jgi:hypothetical protein
MLEWTELTWDEAMRRGYEALITGDNFYEDIDVRVSRSNIDIEKHLRRVEIKTSQAQAWFMIARELDRRRTTDVGPTG